MRWFALLRSLFFGVLFMSLWTYFVPRWLGLEVHEEGVFAQPARLLGLIPLLLGFLGMLWCVFDFSWFGHGTPAPFDAPRKFVSRGPYRNLRNPMYLSAWLFLWGEAILLARWRWSVVAYLFAPVGIVHAFVLLYEEPVLRAKFGEEYKQYCTRVNRWLPQRPRLDA